VYGATPKLDPGLHPGFGIRACAPSFRGEWTVWFWTSRPLRVREVRLFRLRGAPGDVPEEVPEEGLEPPTRGL
jgi:hypothetical protein